MIADFGLLKWVGQAKLYHIMLSRLAKLACVEAVFPNTIWNGLLAVEVFPKCVYVRTVDSRITVYTMHVFCCIFTMVFHLYFVVLRELVGAVT